MHMLARVCLFCISPPAADNRFGESTELSASGAMDYSISEDSFAWQGHWDIAPF